MSEQEEFEEASLDDLSQAFAKVMRKQTGDKEEENASPAAPDSTDEKPAEPEPKTAVIEDACPITPKSIVEAILFVGHPENEPIEAASIAKLLRGVDEQEVDSLICELNSDYEADELPFRILAEGAGYSLQLLAEFDSVRERFYGRIRQVRLSQLAIDVLAVVAYHQPVTREEVDKLLNNGVPSGRVLNQLVRRDLLARRTTEDSPKRREFITTDRFLDLFELSDLGDLPQSEDPQ